MLSYTWTCPGVSARASSWASGLPQEVVPVGSRTVHRAVARMARARTASQRPQGWFRHLMGTTVPPPVIGLDRFFSADVHQLRAGYWAGSTQYLHRIGKMPVPECPQYRRPACRGGFCPLCREEQDTPSHVLLRSPALMRLRFQMTGSMHCPRAAEARETHYVAAMGAAFRRLQGR